jgi:hypothetical protein
MEWSKVRQLAARAKRQLEKVQGSANTGVNWLRLIIVAITAGVVGVDFYFHRTPLDAISSVSALLGILILAWSVFTKSRKSDL